MKCSDARREISSGFDGDELDLAVDEHLRHCTDCEDFADQLLRVRRHLRIGSIGETPDLASVVVPLIGARANRHLRVRRFGSIAAAVIALAATGVGYSTSGDSPSTAAGHEHTDDGTNGVLVAWSAEGLPEGLDDVIAGLDPVVASSRAEITTVRLSTDGIESNSIGYEVFGYDPDTYPTFASATNRTELTGLGPGEALLSQRTATMQNLKEGATLRFANGVELRVAGVVAEEDIARAEIAVVEATARSLQAEQSDRPDEFVLVEYAGGSESMQQQITGAAEGVSFRSAADNGYLRGGADPTPSIDRKVALGDLELATFDGSVVATDPDWRDANIVTSRVPVLGEVQCHRQMLLPLAAAMHTAIAEGHADHIDPTLATRCFVPRVDESIAGANLYTWGIAIDLNFDPSTGRAKASPHLIDIMDRHGFDMVQTETTGTSFVWRITG